MVEVEFNCDAARSFPSGATFDVGALGLDCGAATVEVLLKAEILWIPAPPGLAIWVFPSDADCGAATVVVRAYMVLEACGLGGLLKPCVCGSVDGVPMLWCDTPARVEVFAMAWDDGSGDFASSFLAAMTPTPKESYVSLRVSKMGSCGI